MSRKDRKDRAGLRPTTLDLTASEVKDEPAEPSHAGEDAKAAPSSDEQPAARADDAGTVSSPPGVERSTDSDGEESARAAEPLRAEAAFAQAVDSERDAPPLDSPQAAPSGGQPPKQRSGGGWRAWTLGLLTSAAIGAGGVWWLTGQGSAPAEMAALKVRLEAAETRVEAIARDLAEARTALSQVSAGLADVTGKQQQAVAALDQKIAAIPAGGANEEIRAEVDGQRDAIARLDAAVGELKSAIAAASKGGDAGAASAEAQLKLTEFGARLDDLSARLSALPQGSGSADAAVGQLANRLDGLEQQLRDGLAQAGAASAAPRALTAALTGLQTRLAEGAPFASELAAARQAAPQLAALTTLDPIAATGAPTLDQLKASFANVITAVNASADTPAAAPPQTLWDTVMAKLSGVVKVRHQSAVVWPDAVAAAAKQLADNDLAAAVATLSRPSDPPPVVADWRRGAQARLDADAALQDALQDAVRLMSGTANGG